MQVDELTRALHAGEVAPGHVDVARIRARGRRLRWVRRGRVAGVAAVAAGVVLAGVSVLGGAGVGRAEAPGIADSPGERTLSPYEKRVLRTVDGAYAVGGVVVVPGPVDPASEMNHRFAPGELSPRIVDLGFHGFTGLGYVDSTTDYPRFMRGVIPDDAQVAVDNGPASLACASWEGKPCHPAVLIGGADVGWFYLYGIGTDRFLKPGADMEVFLDDTYVDHTARQSVIGGFDGTAATRVVLTLVDGSHLDADLDSGHVSAGDTLFWGQVAKPVAHVTAYDASGDVVAEHTIRSCSGGVDCEVR